MIYGTNFDVDSKTISIAELVERYDRDATYKMVDLVDDLEKNRRYDTTREEVLATVAKIKDLKDDFSRKLWHLGTIIGCHIYASEIFESMQKAGKELKILSVASTCFERLHRIFDEINNRESASFREKCEEIIRHV